MRVKLELDKDMAMGRYANLALVAHTATEFIIDFALAYPQQSPRVTARVITSPQHAKAFLKSLEDNLRRFEAKHGKIELPKGPGRARRKELRDSSRSSLKRPSNPRLGLEPGRPTCRPNYPTCPEGGL